MQDLDYNGEPFAFNPAATPSYAPNWKPAMPNYTAPPGASCVNPRSHRRAGRGLPLRDLPHVQVNEEREFGEYRTQRLVLEARDKLEIGESH